MKLNKGTKRRTIVYFTIISLLMVFSAIFMTTELRMGLAHKNWKNGPGNVTIGRMTTHWEHFSIRPEDEDIAYTIATDENGEASVKGMPLQLFVYGVGEDFEVPEHWGFKVSDIMRIVCYSLSILLILCFILILANVLKGFRNGRYFSRIQVVLLRWSSLICFLTATAGELCSKFSMIAIGDIYGKSSSVKMATVYQIEIQEIIIPFLLLILAEIINIALHFNEEETMTI